ncbi:hypothetical protein CPB83DRAFT_858339 [Crepidotus variabilis]|uniref:Fungal-type protein kinase domain-containing protein n=1 Tax=Crepidotus variabilis TaxID=179855 RepID=A0A9P6EBM8_9AGAR|nr:hypothetical protein CPB83DRAFT_858339 [Crepidotus variabilis]
MNILVTKDFFLDTLLHRQTCPNKLSSDRYGAAKESLISIYPPKPKAARRQGKRKRVTPKTPRSEVELQSKVLSAINDNVLEGTGLMLIDTGNHTDSNQIRRDASLVTEKVASAAKVSRASSKGRKKAKTDRCRISPTEQQGSGEFKLLPIELFKDAPLPNTQPLSGPAGILGRAVPNSEKPDADKFREQVDNYALTTLRSSHRTRVFQYFISGRRALFFMYDRGATFVSESFDWVEDPLPLIDFFWYLANADDSTRGIDNTVVELTDNAEEVLQSGANELLKPYLIKDQQAKFMKITVHVEVSAGDQWVEWDSSFNDTPIPNTTREYVVQTPLATPGNIHGRGTRVYPAVELVVGEDGSIQPAKSVCLLKEAWRSEYVVPEWNSILHLNNDKIEFVPTLRCAGSVLGRYTVTTSYGCRGFDRRFLHRIVTEEVGDSLFKFKDLEHLFKVLLDIVKAHEGATRQSEIIHRDISSGNILIYNGRGLLNDWDMAKSREDTGARAHIRTGTWEFMAIRLCKLGDFQVDIRDDMESVFWVLLWVLVHSFALEDQANLKPIHSELFQFYVSGLGGGLGKSSFTDPESKLSKRIVFCNDLLDRIVQRARDMVRASVEYEEDLFRYNRARNKLQTMDRSPSTSTKTAKPVMPELPPLQDYEAVRHVFEQYVTMFEGKGTTRELSFPTQHPPDSMNQRDSMDVEDPKAITTDDELGPSKKRKITRATPAPQRRSTRKCVVDQKSK